MKQLCLTVWELQGFEGMEEKDKSLTDLIINDDKAVCITALATPGLLLIFVWSALSLRFHVSFYFLVSAELHIEENGNVSFAKILQWKDI